jgi:hypothetical protein
MVAPLFGQIYIICSPTVSRHVNGKVAQNIAHLLTVTLLIMKSFGRVFFQGTLAELAVHE